MGWTAGVLALSSALTFQLAAVATDELEIILFAELPFRESVVISSIHPTARSNSNPSHRQAPLHHGPRYHAARRIPAQVVAISRGWGWTLRNVHHGGRQHARGISKVGASSRGSMTSKTRQEADKLIVGKATSVAGMRGMSLPPFRIWWWICRGISAEPPVLTQLVR